MLEYALLFNNVWYYYNVFKLTKHFFRRSDDRASARGCHEEYKLSDGSRFIINIEVIYYPKDKTKTKDKFVWYISVASFDKTHQLASISQYGRKTTGQQVRDIYNKVMSMWGILATHPYKERQKIMNHWM